MRFETNGKALIRSTDNSKTKFERVIDVQIGRHIVQGRARQDYYDRFTGLQQAPGDTRELKCYWFSGRGPVFVPKRDGKWSE